MSLLNDHCYLYYIRESSITHDKKSDQTESDIYYINALEKILRNYQFKKSILASIKFFCYSQAYLRKLVYNGAADLKKIEECNSKENFKLNKKFTCGFKLNLKYFLIHRNCNKLLKVIYKIGGRI